MATFFDSEQNLDQAKLEEVEQFLGISFPNVYREHLLQYNGGRCEPSNFSFIENGKTSSSYVDYFLAIYNGSYDNFLEYFHDYKIEKKRMPSTVFPIAHDPGGNLVCIDTKDGQVYFWNHENEVNYELEDDSNYSNLYLIANDFKTFINTLY